MLIHPWIMGFTMHVPHILFPDKTISLQSNKAHISGWKCMCQGECLYICTGTPRRELLEFFHNRSWIFGRNGREFSPWKSTFFPMFFHPFSDRNGGFHQNSSGSLGSSISSILASGKLTDSYGKNTSFKTLRDKFIINHHKSSRNGQSSMTMCYNVVQNQRLIIWYHRVLLLQVFPSSELPLAIFSIPS